LQDIPYLSIEVRLENRESGLERIERFQAIVAFAEEVF
jgi:hypothetical protein